MRKTLIFLLVIFFVIDLVGIGIYFYRKTKETSVSSTPVPEKKPAKAIGKSFQKPIPKIQIIYQDKKDKEGRTALYNYGLYSGVGENKQEGAIYYVGLFKSWESIFNSQDKYLILENPFTKTLLPKFHVLYLPLNKGDLNTTALAQEEINNGKINFGKAIGDYSSEELNNLIKPGDAIVVFPLRDRNGASVKDKEGNVAALWLYTRIIKK